MNNRLFALFVIGFMGLLAFQEHQQATKKYKVEADLNFWIQATNGIEFTKNNLKTSDLPSKTVTLINDSLLTPLQMEIGRQINEQLALEKKKADTTISKLKKN
jgi:hypothetical protein